MFLVESKLLTFLYQKTGGCLSQWHELDNDLPAQLKLEEKAAEVKEANTKRKGASAEPSILGPGQAGSESLSVAPPTKKTKATIEDMDDADDDDDEVGTAKDLSIAERLKQLSNAFDDDDEKDEEQEETATSFVPRMATTESLKEFLSQALQSDDDSLLELALGVRDPKVIAQTLKEIDASLIVVLLGKLTARLAANPLRAQSLALWLSHCMRTGRFQVHHLTSLRNLLHERIESFPDLLRLEGRLSMMCE
jgi:hypothetical protein